MENKIKCGDTRWMMDNNIPVQIVVEKITTHDYINSDTVIRLFYKVPDRQYEVQGRTKLVDILSTLTFPSKDELMNNVFGLK